MILWEKKMDGFGKVDRNPPLFEPGLDEINVLLEIIGWWGREFCC